MSTDISMFYDQYRNDINSDVPIDNSTPIDELKKEYEECSLCALCKDRNKVVFGYGNYNPTFMFIGPKPSVYDSDIGIPFSDKPGKKLQGIVEYLKSNGDEKWTVWYTNLVLCPTNKPHEEHIKACHARLQKEIIIVNPKYLVFLGDFVAEVFGAKGGRKKKQVITLEKHYECFTITDLHSLFYKRDEVIKDLVDELNYIVQTVKENGK